MSYTYVLINEKKSWKVPLIFNAEKWIWKSFAIFDELLKNFGRSVGDVIDIHNEKIMIFTRWGFMPKLHKKTSMVSNYFVCANYIYRIHIS